MRVKKYTFFYEKRHFDYQYNGHPLLSTWSVTKDITILRGLEKIKEAQYKVNDKFGKNTVKFDYKLKPDSYGDEGRIIIKTNLSQYQAYELLEEVLYTELKFKIKN